VVESWSAKWSGALWWLGVERLAFVLVAMSAAVSDSDSDSETALRSCREFAQ
jgi:hypothetical protein